MARAIRVEPGTNVMRAIRCLCCWAVAVQIPLAVLGHRAVAQVPQPPVAAYSNAVVATDHVCASQAGIEILRKGGNVVDAAIAASFALSVVRPASCGIGGGGFMLIWNAERREAVAIDYRERAPAAATRNMFVDVDDEEEPASRTGHLAVAVPGTVAGLCRAAELYGSLPLSTLLRPALRLADNGVRVDAIGRRVQIAVLNDFIEHPGYNRRFATFTRLYLNQGQPWLNWSVFHSPQGEALSAIAGEGRSGFYRGPVADAIVAEMHRGGGLVTHHDLESYKASIRAPLKGRFLDTDIIAMPPPSSGGVAIIEMLNILTEWNERNPELCLEGLGHNSSQYIHLITEALKQAFADRAAYLGDADFADVPVERLISQERARQFVARIDTQWTRSTEEYGTFLPVNDSGTSHISIIDASGNAVACTETVNTYFGSYTVEPQFGIVLNNEMDDFSARPGTPNAFGLMQSEANAIAPGKRPLSSMSPTIVVRDGKAVHVLGASGGPRIISATLQMLLNQMLFGMTPDVAVCQPRFHHQWLPETLLAEPELYKTTHHALQQRGHDVRRSDSLAVVQSASRSVDGVRGAGDRRKLGRAVGY